MSGVTARVAPRARAFVARPRSDRKRAIGAQSARSHRARGAVSVVDGALGRSSARARVVARASDGKRPTKAPEELAERFTTGGGGADGFCDFDDIKEALKQCEGLEGARLEACYAEYGCTVEAVTNHYAKAAGIKKDEKKK